MLAFHVRQDPEMYTMFGDSVSYADSYRDSSREAKVDYFIFNKIFSIFLMVIVTDYAAIFFRQSKYVRAAISSLVLAVLIFYNLNSNFKGQFIGITDDLNIALAFILVQLCIAFCRSNNKKLVSI